MTQAETKYRKSSTTIDDPDQRILGELPQVHHIARRIYERLPQHVSFEDLVHAGVIGLIESARSYDTSKCVPFNAYAKFRIRGAILDSLRDLDWGTRRLRRESRRIDETISKLSQELGRQPEDEEIAAALRIPLEKLFETMQTLDGLILAGQEVAPSSDGSGKVDLIENARSDDKSPFDHCLASEVRNDLADAIKTLNEKEQLVVSLHYKDDLTMKEISSRLQLSESRVSQIHSTALPKIRAALPTSGFDTSLME